MINSIDTEDTFNNDIIHNLNNCKLDMKQYLHIINITHDKCTANILNFTSSARWPKPLGNKEIKVHDSENRKSNSSACR